VVMRAMHLHGALGVSNEMPFAGMLLGAEIMAIADGPTEVHKVTIARQVLKDHSAVDTLFPSGHLPTRREQARRDLADVLDLAAASL
jgi:acyl-CoA dehydrogenase